METSGRGGAARVGRPRTQGGGTARSGGGGVRTRQLQGCRAATERKARQPRASRSARAQPAGARAAWKSAEADERGMGVSGVGKCGRGCEDDRYTGRTVNAIRTTIVAKWTSHIRHVKI